MNEKKKRIVKEASQSVEKFPFLKKIKDKIEWEIRKPGQKHQVSFFFYYLIFT